MIKNGNGLLVWLGVSDLDRACDFYAETLGLEVLHMDTQAGWAEFSHPKTKARLALQQTDPEELMPSGGATVIFDVPQLNKTMKKLEKAGVPFLTGAISMNGFRIATFIDPDGNHLQLRESEDKKKAN